MKLGKWWKEGNHLGPDHFRGRCASSLFLAAFRLDSGSEADVTTSAHEELLFTKLFKFLCSLLRYYLNLYPSLFIILSAFSRLSARTRLLHSE